MSTPHARAELTMLNEFFGGRKSPLLKAFLFEYKYRPHIVIENLSVRKIHRQMNSMSEIIGNSNEEYLGVAFSYASEEPQPNNKILVDFAYIYHEKVSYTKAVEGAFFTLREGGSIVGTGKVLSTFSQNIDLS